MDKDNLLNLQELDIEQICLNNDFGQLKFENSVTYLQRMQKDLIELEELAFRTKLAPSEIRDINQAMERFWELINSIRTFSIIQQDPQNLKNAIETEVANFYDNFANLTRRHLVYLKQEILLENKNDKKLLRRLKQAEELNDRMQRLLEQTEADKKSIAKEQGIISSRYLSQVFSAQANSYETSLKNYPYYISCIIITLIVLVIVIGFIYYHFSITQKEDNLRIEIGILGGVLIAIIYYLLRLVIRSFNAKNHLKEINIHRANVAQTLENFLGTSEDLQTKEALLKEAASAMFAMETTGYLNKDQMEISSPVTEMVTNFIKDK